MRRFVTIWLMALIFLSLLIGGRAHASITDLKLSTAQIFDVQWYISGGVLNASSFNYIYASINYATQTNSAARWTAAQTTDAGSNNRYIGFFSSTTNPGTYGMAVFNSNGSVYKIINNTGSFLALANGAIFYNGNGMWGTLITTGAGYSYGQSGSWTITQSNPTNAQLQAYIPPSSTPLAAGQTAAPAAPAFDGTITQTNPSGSTYSSDSGSSNITSTQQTKVNLWTTRVITQTGIWIDQIGDGNSVTIDQAGVGLVKATIRGSASTVTVNQGSGSIGQNEADLRLTGDNNTVTINQARGSNGTMQGTNGHYQSVEINGYQNTVTATQNNTGGVGGHYVETTINGNQNNVTERQTDNGNKIMFASVNGNNNSVDVTQRGTGQHYLDLKLTGNGNGALITQEGTTGNKATVDLTNAGGAATLDLQQSGGKTFSIQQSCVTASGCSTTVRQ